MSTLNEEYLLDFQSIPNLSPKDRQQLSRAAFLAFFCAEDFCIRSSTIKRYVTKCVSRDSKGNRQEILVKDFGKFDIKEFLKLPEISCLIYQFKLQDSKCCYKYYQSVFNSIKNGEKCMIYWFRKSIITCIQKAVDQKLGDNYGNITLNILCDTFNDTFGFEYGWHCNLEEKITFLGDKTFFYALCFYCSKEIVINFHQNLSPKFRLRNHPNYLFKEIVNEQILAAKTIKVYNQYYKNNPDQILWFTLIPDLNFTDIPSSLSEYVSYPPTLIENVYAAFHRSSTAISDFQRLMKVIKKMDNYKKASDISNLVEMLSPESLMAIECWDLQEQLLFSKITDDYILNLDKSKQNSLFQQLKNIWMSEFNEYPPLSA